MAKARSAAVSSSVVMGAFCGEGGGGDVAVGADAEVDVLGAAGCGEVGLGDLVVGGVEADLESFGFAGPAFAFGFGDAVLELSRISSRRGRWAGSMRSMGQRIPR